MSLRPLAALSSRVWWGYPAATPGAVAGVTAPPTARRGRYRAADGRGPPIERACSARLGRTGLGAQQGCRVPRAVSIGRRRRPLCANRRGCTKSLASCWADVWRRACSQPSFQQ